jgi:hypothetical protein
MKAQAAAAAAAAAEAVAVATRGAHQAAEATVLKAQKIAQVQTEVKVNPGSCLECA